MEEKDKVKPVTQKRKSWFTNMLSGTNGDVSSKRFFGGIGLMVMHCIAIFAVITHPDSHWMGELLITLTITDTGLLGVGVLEKERPSRTRARLAQQRAGQDETPLPDDDLSEG